ncbi:hypothetical protein BDR05DRAFT_968846 [Suillus weaverae]|nr:hypothetical protein BDR05DRAFT_968846 [Suillus weaverae]
MSIPNHAKPHSGWVKHRSHHDKLFPTSSQPPYQCLPMPRQCRITAALNLHAASAPRHTYYMMPRQISPSASAFQLSHYPSSVPCQLILACTNEQITDKLGQSSSLKLCRKYSDTVSLLSRFRNKSTNCRCEQRQEYE